MICENLDRNAMGELTLAGVGVKEMAKKYGTPLYLYDEDRIRERCRVYKNGLSEAFGDGYRVLYASKAASFKRLYEIMKDEGVGIDVVSPGEIKTALCAGFPMERAYFHSNNKTDWDIEYAISSGVGYLVVDNEEELYSISRIACTQGVVQKILLRITPGIDPHTYKAVNTGMVDSKFGSAIETGQAMAITAAALGVGGVRLAGFHCHIGSQIFDSSVYLKASSVMLGFIKDVKDTLGYEAEELDIGGGLGVRYTENDPEIDIAERLREVGEYVNAKARELGIRLPVILVEPGRSIVADAGMTVYTVGTVKRIPGYKSYVSVDGGMTDNPRYALYGSRYTVLTVDEPVGDGMTCTLAGRCCESGDILQENITLPENIKRGDYVAVLTTGAYNYSMASNYNRLPRPAVVMLRDGEDYLAVRRERLEDIVSLDI